MYQLRYAAKLAAAALPTGPTSQIRDICYFEPVGFPAKPFLLDSDPSHSLSYFHLVAKPGGTVPPAQFSHLITLDFLLNRPHPY